MFGQFLICIFSYNRAALLRNLLQSVAQFYPDMGLAIFDDGSEDEDTLALLQEQREAGNHVYSSAENTAASKHGGLYAQMNAALDYGTAQGYKYLYFVQDDMQFLWRDEHLPERVQQIFRHPECLMCNFNFLQKILIEGLEERLPKSDHEDLYWFQHNGVADTGIIDVEKARYAELRFKYNSEHENGRYWGSQGYKMYWSPVSHMAWVPWPSTYRNRKLDKRAGKVLKPLDKETIKQIQQNTGYSFLEDYTSLERFAIKPYWYTADPGRVNLFKIYLKYYLHRLL